MGFNYGSFICIGFSEHDVNEDFWLGLFDRYYGLSFKQKQLFLEYGPSKFEDEIDVLFQAINKQHQKFKLGYLRCGGYDDWIYYFGYCKYGYFAGRDSRLVNYQDANFLKELMIELKHIFGREASFYFGLDVS